MGNRNSTGQFTSRPVPVGSNEPQMGMVGTGGPKAKSRKDELADQLKAEDEHSQMQLDGEKFLHTIEPLYKPMQDQISNEIFSWFQHQGFWPKDWHPSNIRDHFSPDEDVRTITIPFNEYVRLKKMEKLGLIVTEVAETMEAVRNDDDANEREEIADIEVRLHDYKGGFGMTELTNPFQETAADSFISKMLKNFQRPFRHGKKF